MPGSDLDPVAGLVCSMFAVLLDGLTCLVMLLSLRSTSSFSVLVRPQKKNSSALRMSTLSAATTMPAMAPGPRLCFWVPTVGTVVELGGFEGAGDSAGNGSPGFNMYTLFRASCCCVEIGVLEFGLMAPTMPYVMHEPGAEQ
jgi:hypothetical protein